MLSEVYFTSLLYFFSYKTIMSLLSLSRNVSFTLANASFRGPHFEGFICGLPAMKELLQASGTFLWRGPCILLDPGLSDSLAYQSVC